MSNPTNLAISTLVAALSLGVSLPASAGDGEKKERAKERFEQLDSDKDGELSKKEYIAHRKGKDKMKAAVRFKKMDTNNDGVVSSCEFKAAAKARSKAR